MLTLGTGIGGGLVLDGELYRGWIGGGAEIGHMVVDIDGPPCQGNCPNWGCLEARRLRHARSCARWRCASHAGPTPRSGARSRRASS